MTAIDLELLAFDTFDAYSLWGWKLVVGKPTRVRLLGLCDYAKKEIFINAELLTHGGDKLLLETFYHEVAHALTPGAGHGAAWKAMAERLGCPPRAKVALAELGINLPSIEAFSFKQEAKKN